MRLLHIPFILLISFNSNAKDYYEQALTAYDAKDIETSYIHLKNALKENSDNLPAKVLMGQVLLQKGLYSDGVDEFQESLLLGADPNLFIYDMGRAQLLLKEYKAVIELESTPNLSKENKLNMLLLQSNAYRAMKRERQALDSLKRAATIAPKNLKTLAPLASYYVDQRNFESAEKLLNQALTIAPNNTRILHLQGEFYNAQGRGLLALDAFEKAYSSDSSDPVVLRSLANQYSYVNKLDRALEFVDKILALTPYDTYTELLKSRLLIQNGKNDEAQTILGKISSQLSTLTDRQKAENLSLAYVAGSAAFLQGNYEVAQNELTRYVNENPDDLSGINMLVDIYYQQKQIEKVEALLERHESRIKKDLNLSLNLYSIYLKNNKIFKAKGLLNELETLFKNNLLVTLAKANYLVKSNRAPEAIALLKQNAPKNFEASYELNRGQLYLSMNDIANASTIADRLLEHSPNESSFLIFKGIVLSKQRQWQQATTYFNQVLELSPDNFSAKFNLATTLAALNKKEQALEVITPLLEQYPNVDSLILLSAKLNRDLNNSNQSIKLLTKLLKLKARNIQASELLFEIYYANSQYELALEEANRLNSLSFLSPQHLIYKIRVLTKLQRYDAANIQIGRLMGLAEADGDFFQLSKLQSDAGFIENALKSINTSIDKSPDNKIYQLEKARLLISTNDTDSATMILNKLYRTNKNDPNVLFSQGLLLEKKSLPKQAFKKFSDALTKDNNFNGAATKMYMLAQQGVEQSAFIKDLERLLATSANNHFARNLLADFYLFSNKYPQALKHYHALEDKPVISRSRLFNNIAYIYSASDLDKAQEYIKKAYELSPNSPSILDSYGWILSLKGQYTESLEKLRQAYAFNANDPVIHYHLGYTLAKLGRNSDAISELEKALNMNTRFAEKSDAEALLASLRSS